MLQDRKGLAEQSGSEVFQIITPRAPSMPCLVRLAVFIVDAILVEDLIGLLPTDVGDVCRSTLGVGEDLEALVEQSRSMLRIVPFDTSDQEEEHDDFF